jgi:phosphoglycolate phosphatase
LGGARGSTWERRPQANPPTSALGEEGPR